MNRSQRLARQSLNKAQRQNRRPNPATKTAEEKRQAEALAKSVAQIQSMDDLKSIVEVESGR